MHWTNQADLGFSQMKAAILGGHSIIDSWCEIAGMMGGGKRVYVLHGGVACLLDCTDVLDEAGLLPEIPDYHDFLHSGSNYRLAACVKAIDAGDLLALSRLVSVMALCISRYQSHFSFNGRRPLLCRQR